MKLISLLSIMGAATERILRDKSNALLLHDFPVTALDSDLYIVKSYLS